MTAPRLQSAAMDAVESSPVAGVAAARDDWAARVLEAIPDGVVMVDETGRIASMNAAGEQMFGWGRDEVAGRPLSQLIVPPVLRRPGWEELLGLDPEPEPWLVGTRVETLGRRRGCEEFPVELLMTRSSEVPVLFTAFVRDLSGLRQLECRGRNAERLLSAGERLADFGTWDLDLTTRRTRWSDGMWRISGLEPDQRWLSIERVLETVHPGDRARIAAILAAVVEQPNQVAPECMAIEYRAIRADGSVREVVARGWIELDESGRPARWVGCGHDVTDQRLVQRGLSAHLAVGRALRKWESFQHSVVPFLREFCSALELPIASFWSWNAEDGCLKRRASWFAPGTPLCDFDETLGWSALRPGESMSGVAWQVGSPLLIEDLRTDPRMGPVGRACATRLELRSGIAVPAMHDGERLALVSFYSAEPVTASERLLLTLSEIGGEIGRFLSRRRADLGRQLLTQREVEILQLAAEGNTGPTIAKLLVVSPATVKTHFENMYEKLGVGDRAAAVAHALRLGLIH